MSIKSQFFANLVASRGYTAAEVAAAFSARARRDRRERPDGSWDGAGRFNLAETCGSVCEGYRTASRAYPYSELKHGSTVKHVAGLYRVAATNVRRLVALLDAIDGATPQTAHEAVAILRDHAAAFAAVKQAG